MSIIKEYFITVVVLFGYFIAEFVSRVGLNDSDDTQLLKLT